MVRMWLAIDDAALIALIAQTFHPRADDPVYGADYAI